MNRRETLFCLSPRPDLALVDCPQNDETGVLGVEALPFECDLAPRHYNADEPLTHPLVQYVSELIGIRKQFQDLLFFGRFNDRRATVQGGPDVRCSVFKSMDPNNKDIASVIVNFGDAPETAELSIDGAAARSPLQLPISLIIKPHCRCGCRFPHTGSSS